MPRRTKIVATIGPASQSEEIIEKLILAGMNVARMNFSHGTHEQHAERIATIRKVATRLGIPVGILQDLQGPKIRVGNLPLPLQLAVGEIVCLYAADDSAPVCSNQLIPVDFPELFESVHVNDRLLLDDGRLAFSVISVEKRTLEAQVVVGGTLSAHKGINLPGVKIRVAGFTPKDEADLAFGLQQNVDAVQRKTC
jgi:pyruvate kinase